MREVDEILWWYVQCPASGIENQSNIITVQCSVTFTRLLLGDKWMEKENHLMIDFHNLPGFMFAIWLARVMWLWLKEQLKLEILGMTFSLTLFFKILVRTQRVSPLFFSLHSKKKDTARTNQIVMNTEITSRTWTLHLLFSTSLLAIGSVFNRFCL